MRLWVLLSVLAAAAATKPKDPCHQPRKSGPCKALIPRWYFSTKAGKCLKFSWGGCQPNGNNFKSEAECNGRCSPCAQPQKVGPCKARKPRWYFSTSQGKCLQFFWGGCQANANNFETMEACEKMCCSGGCGDPCMQPRRTGRCRAAIPRWYYSALLGKCLKFIWGGCDANGNNFDTEDECNKKCNPCAQERKIGPCRAAIPRWYFSTKTMKCLKFSWGGCHPNGNNFETLEACNKQCCKNGCGDPCTQPRRTGRCRAAIPRWYYSALLGKCLKFIWGGCDANGNNFDTEDECNKKCNLCAQPRKAGPCEAAIPRWYFSNKDGKCLKFFWGGCQPNGNNFKTLEECSKQCCKDGCGSPCSQPLKVGPCRAAIPRWYFSSKAGKCLKFLWGGCQPNSNNFESMEDCNKQCCKGHGCGTQRPKLCQLPSKSGRCLAYFERFYFDGKKCSKFVYGGCEANENNFMTIEECKKVCRA